MITIPSLWVDVAGFVFQGNFLWLVISTWSKEKALLWLRMLTNDQYAAHRMLRCTFTLVFLKYSSVSSS